MLIGLDINELYITF